ncbi:MAG TPA: MmgE/PrpD family protein, partial [Burkholderiales bacterium]|nr:MmgE/PrpD family protein [Burkholderiales bacterium]
MTTAARTLAEFAVGLRYEVIPNAVIERAKTCIIDTVGAMTFGADLPWSRIMIEYVHRTSAPGKGSIVGTEYKARGQLAALANGVLAHAFELDSLCDPSVGVHPGASLTAPGIPVAQAQGRSGKELLTAFVAGFEVMYRIGDAARHSSEKIGFHAPGLTGVFGGAIVTGLLMKLDSERMTNALGIAGSLCSGLLEFSKSGGGMVKRLHLGRAAEGGAMAATLAREGYTGPETVLEGKFGFLNVFAREQDPLRLTRGLGEEWHTLTTMLKRYACHITAHVPVTAALELRAQHGFKGSDVASVSIATNEKVVSHHNILEPQDTMMAQYSVPFCVALALHRDPVDPRVFGEAS